MNFRQANVFLKRTQRSNFKGKTEIGISIQRTSLSIRKEDLQEIKKKVVIQNQDKRLDPEYIKNSNKNPIQFF